LERWGSVNLASLFAGARGAGGDIGRVKVKAKIQRVKASSFDLSQRSSLRLTIAASLSLYSISARSLIIFPTYVSLVLLSRTSCGLESTSTFTLNFRD